MRLIENELIELREKTRELARMVQFQFEECARAIRQLDYALADRVRRKEKAIEKKDHKIERRCERILALYQPVATDLRLIFSVLKVNRCLDEIADAINSVVRKVMHVEAPFQLPTLEKIQLPKMLALVDAVLRDAIRSFFSPNATDSRALFARDNEIDEINAECTDTIADLIRETPERAYDFLQIHAIIKKLEKVADYAIEIAQISIFLSEGVTYTQDEIRELAAVFGNRPNELIVST